MSGRKTTMVSISNDELRTLRNRAAQATCLQESSRVLNQLCEKNDAALAQYRNRINTLNSNIDSLNRRLAEQSNAASKETQALRSQLQQAVRESNTRLQVISRQNEARVQEMHENFTSALSQTRADMADALSANNRRIEAAMRQNNQRLESQMNELEGQMNSEFQMVHNRLESIETAVQDISHDNDSLLEMAREYSRIAQILLDEIQQNYRVELLCPGRLSPVLESANSAISEINDSVRMPQNSATARFAARNALEEANHLYQDVIIAEQEWQLRYEETRQIIDATIAQVDASRTIKLPEEDGSDEVDVDHWTDGDLHAIESRVESLANHIKNPERLSLEDLEGIKAAGLQASREIDDTAVFALEAYCASEDRAYIASVVGTKLDDYGLTVIDYSYCGEDFRSAHRIHLRNNQTGFEIVITQTPEVNENGNVSNRLESDILNYGNLNEEHGDALALEVLSSLADLGFQQSAIVTTTGFEGNVSDRTEVVELQRWRNEKKPEVIKPNHSTS